MKEHANLALNLATQYGASYADVRIVERDFEAVYLKNRAIEGVVNTHSYGMGIRVLVDGFFGFAANPDLVPAKIDIAVRRAIDIARASASVGGGRTRLTEERPHVGEWNSRFEIDPFKVPLERKIGHLMACEEIMAKEKKVAVTRSSMNFLRETKHFASTEGASITQRVLQSGGGISAMAVDGSEVQVRSYPASFRGQYKNAGYELIESLKLAENAAHCASEAVQLLTAPQCPSGLYDIIIGKSQLALQVHESCGHATELDRVFGMEANYAGMTFLTTDKLGKFRYGSEIVNIDADATCTDGLGGYAFDDDGVPARRTPIIENGMFVGYISSRDTASRVGLATSGNARAEDWNAIPLVRMSCHNLRPGHVSYEDMIASTERGLILNENKSWSIDDLRLNFQFGMELGYVIEKGKITGTATNPTYTGITPEFWRSCDAIADRDSWNIWGVPNCGKGQPTQTMRVAHGVSYARFRNVKVGVGYDQ